MSYLKVNIYPKFFLIAGLLVGLFACSEGPQEGNFRSVFAEPPPRWGPSEPVMLLPSDLPEGRKELRFGVSPALGREVAREASLPLVAYLEEVLKVPVNLMVAESYQALVDWTIDEKVDVALLPPLTYVKAREENPALVPLVAKLGRGASHYSSYIIVRAEGNIQSVGDLKGKTIAFVDPTSSSGYLLPYDYLMRQGVNPEKDLASFRFAGSHSAALRMLALGQVDAAASGSGMRDILRSELKDIDGQGDTRLRILANAGAIPYDALCVQGSVPESGRRKLKEAFLELNTLSPQGRAVWRASGDIVGWMPFDDALFASVRRTLRQVRKWRSKPKHSEKGGM